MLKKAPADSIRTGFVALSAVGFPFLEEHAAICLSTDFGDKFFLNTLYGRKERHDPVK